MNSQPVRQSSVLRHSAGYKRLCYAETGQSGGGITPAWSPRVDRSCHVQPDWTDARHYAVFVLYRNNGVESAAQEPGCDLGRDYQTFENAAEMTMTASTPLLTSSGSGQRPFLGQVIHQFVQVSDLLHERIPHLLHPKSVVGALSESMPRDEGICPYPARHPSSSSGAPRSKHRWPGTRKTVAEAITATQSRLPRHTATYR